MRNDSPGSLANVREEKCARQYDRSSAPLASSDALGLGGLVQPWYCTSVPVYQAFCMSKQCCTRKNWYVPKKFLVQGPFWFSVRSSVPSRRLCAMMAHENERIARENEKNEARGDEGARRGFRRSEAPPNWSTLSRSCLFVTRHASWRSVVRVSNTRPTSIEVRSTSSSTGVGGRHVVKARDAQSSRRWRIRFNQVH